MGKKENGERKENGGEMAWEEKESVKKENGGEMK